MFDKNLLALLGKDKKYVFLLVGFSILGTILNIVITFTLCFIVDALVKGGDDIGHYLMLFGIGMGGAIARLVVNLLIGHFRAVLGTNAKLMLRERIYDKVAKLGVRETDDLSLASLTQVAIEGVEQLDLYYSTYIPQFFFAMISPFILFALLMFISWPTAVVLLVCVPLIPMSIITVSKYAKKIFAKYWDTYTKMGDAFLDNISGMNELKIYNADKARKEKMKGEAEDFRKITMKVLTMQLASTTIMDLVAYGGAGLGIAVSLLNQTSINPLFDLSVPSLVLFVVLVAVDFFLPLRALGSAFHVSMNGATAGKKILKLLNTPEPLWGDERVTGQDIILKGVSFSYDGERTILDGIDIELKKGKIVSVVGTSGSGKSTIVSLLAGNRQNYQGEIKVGGKDIKTLSREDYFTHLDIVSYNTFLFNDTVRNNFRIADKKISDERIYEYLGKVNLIEPIEKMGGLDATLQEDATNLSGGEKQRLALAINLACDKDIYLFDEVTSNIDVESEAIIMKNILALKEEKTILLISHRLKNSELSDEILYLDQGKIVEKGNHESLLALNGEYASLYKAQKALEEGFKEVK